MNRTKVEPHVKEKVELAMYDALNFRARKMLFPYLSMRGRRMVEVDFEKIKKTFKWEI